MTTKEFVEKMTKDEELAKKMGDCKKPEEVYETAKEAGVTDDYDAFVKYITGLNEQLGQELSDEELENAAGGALYGPYGIGETLRTIAILTGRYDPYS